MTKKEVSQEEIRTGRRIRELRQDVLKPPLTQEAFAERLGNVTRGAVGNWERGQGIKRENLAHIAHVFRVSFDWLATSRGTPQSSDQPMDAVARMVLEAAPELGEYETEKLRQDVIRLITDRKEMIARLRQTR